MTANLYKLTRVCFTQSNIHLNTVHVKFCVNPLSHLKRFSVSDITTVQYLLMSSVLSLHDDEQMRCFRKKTKSELKYSELKQEMVL